MTDQIKLLVVEDEDSLRTLLKSELETYGFAVDDADGGSSAMKSLNSTHYDVVILDEINYALSYAFLPVEDVVDFLKKKPPMLHVILTGRDAKPEIVAIADLVTEMREIKHPFQQGISAQKGIEF